MSARRLWAVTAIAAVALLAGACGNKAGGTPAGGNNAAGSGTVGTGGDATNKPSCALAPAALVNSTLGVSMGEPEETVNSVVTACRYASTSGSGSVTVRFQTNEDAAGFARARSGFDDSGQRTTDVPGFFDQAFSSTLGSGEFAINTIVARKGSVEILVTSHASLDKEKELVRRIFAALG
jgi:hypothetical protein